MFAILLIQSLFLFETANRIKFLTIGDDAILIVLFGFLREKSFKISYSDAASLEYANNRVKSFIFTLKSGERREMRADISEKEKAFELIQQKIGK